MGGGTGGYTTASRDIVDVLRHKGRPYVFSNSVTPSVAGATLEVFKMLDE
jgi:glycine C-acetyltransferase